MKYLIDFEGVTCVHLVLGDCLEKMQAIPDHSVDMILCDLPYGITRNKWDTVIPLDPLWVQYKRVIKERGAIVLFASAPFSGLLMLSAKSWFRYEWVWEKPHATNFLQAKNMPLRAHENILVFYKKLPKYNPQMRKGKPYRVKSGKVSSNYDTAFMRSVVTENKGLRYPRSVIAFKTEKGHHQTQKPIPLLEYLIKTYTDPGETVLDNCMGSGSTGVACRNLGRNFIGIEKEKKYFAIAKNRLE